MATVVNIGQPRRSAIGAGIREAGDVILQAIQEKMALEIRQQEIADQRQAQIALQKQKDDAALARTQRTIQGDRQLEFAKGETARLAAAQTAATAEETAFQLQQSKLAGQEQEGFAAEAAAQALAAERTYRLALERNIKPRNALLNFLLSV